MPAHPNPTPVARRLREICTSYPEQAVAEVVLALVGEVEDDAERAVLAAFIAHWIRAGAGLTCPPVSEAFVDTVMRELLARAH